MRFENKVAVITGGTSGIGLAVAQSLMEEGAKVVIAGRSRPRGEVALTKLKQIHPDVLFVPVDVSKSSEVENMVHTALTTFGKLDFAFNNAGNSEGKPALTHEFSEEDFDHMMGVTIKGVWLCMKYELRAMLQNGAGAIVNTSSLDALLSSPGTTAYAAGKSGINTLSRCVAQEYGSEGIRVNTLTPGAFRTPMIERKFAGLSAEDAIRLEGKYNNLNALGRIGTPKEAAAVVTWLLSDDASYITGQNIITDGGVNFVN